MKDYKLDIKININFITTILQSGNDKNEVEEKIRNVLNDIIRNQLKNDYVLDSLIEDVNKLNINFEIISEDITKQN